LVANDTLFIGAYTKGCGGPDPMIFTGEEREWGERGMEREGMTGPADFKT